MLHPASGLHSMTSRTVFRTVPLLLTAALAIAAVHLTATAAGAITYQAQILGPGEAFAISESVVVGRANFGPWAATLWDAETGSSTNLHPSDFWNTEALGVSGGIQVGFGNREHNGPFEALLWHGTAESVTSLTPSWASSSMAYAASGNTQVGSAVYRETFRGAAVLWHGTAESAVDLTPAGYRDSGLLGVSGNSQVGSAELVYTEAHPYGETHAFLWSGTAESAIDLHPQGYWQSVAYGVSGTHQVGEVVDDPSGPLPRYRATLWEGSAESRINLHPSGYFASIALGISGDRQVGYGTTKSDGTRFHALTWNGSRESVIDLHQFLPTGFTTSSASGIDEQGNIVGQADGFAVLWHPQILLGDVNDDGRVDLDDFGILKANFGIGTSLAEGDVNQDGQVNLTDFGILKANFGRSTGVPEPTAGALSLAAVVSIWGVRFVHRRRTSR